VAELTLNEIKALIAKLDDVCRQAAELQDVLRKRMIERARGDRVHHQGQPERRKTQMDRTGHPERRRKR
jgi:hypothetical protein